MARCSSCWQPRYPRMVYGGDQPVLNPDGMIALRDYPDCNEPYNDIEHRSETLYVVGWGTEHEQLFTAARARRALAYSQTFSPRLRNDPVLATQLCRQAVIDAYAVVD